MIQVTLARKEANCSRRTGSLLCSLLDGRQVVRQLGSAVSGQQSLALAIVAGEVGSQISKDHGGDISGGPVAENGLGDGSLSFHGPSLDVDVHDQGDAQDEPRGGETEIQWLRVVFKGMVQHGLKTGLGKCEDAGQADDGPVHGAKGGISKHFGCVVTVK